MKGRMGVAVRFTLAAVFAFLAGYTLGSGRPAFWGGVAALAFWLGALLHLTDQPDRVGR